MFPLKKVIRKWLELDPPENKSIDVNVSAKALLMFTFAKTITIREYESPTFLEDVAKVIAKELIKSGQIHITGDIIPNQRDLAMSDQLVRAEVTHCFVDKNVLSEIKPLIQIVHDQVKSTK